MKMSYIEINKFYTIQIWEEDIPTVCKCIEWEDGYYLLQPLNHPYSPPLMVLDCEDEWEGLKLISGKA